MAYDPPAPGSLKRKRRRRRDRVPLSAKIYLDTGLKGDVGVLSTDIATELIPSAQGTYFVAVTPWTPSTAILESNWVILPVRALRSDEKALPPSTVRFPAASFGTQSFARNMQSFAPTKTIRQNTAIDIRLTDVLPVPLDTVIISVDTDAVQGLEDANRRYAGGISNATAQAQAVRRGKRTVQDNSEEDGISNALTERIQALVNTSLATKPLVHADDLILLPIAHPVTHTAAPPAKILACEPVSQGLITPETNIVIIPASERTSRPHNRRAILSPRLDEESGEEDDTANEAFYSAAEENAPVKPVVTSKSATDMSNTDDMFGSSAEDSNLSDDSDDMISLAKPGLAELPSGISSALTSATPRPFGLAGLASRTQGISTPGSVFSNLTATTVRGGKAVRSKTFRTQGLNEQIPIDMLHPKPAFDEDEEARVYVDSVALARLGCFSGDWVKIEPVENSLLPQLSAFNGLDDSIIPQWRPVKVYTLPESMSRRTPKYPVNTRVGRRDSFSSMPTAPISIATIYLSPILLANMNDPINLSMTPMPQIKRPSLKRPLTPKIDATPARLPPTASEVTLRKIVTPISTERSLSDTLYANVKQYFEEQQRVLKAGDLIAIKVDESLGRSIYEGDAEQDTSSSGALLSQLSTRPSESGDRPPAGVAWFLIEDINVPADELDAPDSEDWAGAAAIDPSRMTMRQSGDCRRKLPSTTTNTWQYYLGVRKLQSSKTVNEAAALVSETGQHVSNLQRRLRDLISVSTSPRAIHMGMPPLTVLITSTQRSIGKARTAERACADLGIHFFTVDAHQLVSEAGSGSESQTHGLLGARCERGLECGPEFTALCITHLEVLNADRTAASLKSILETARVLIATTTDLDKIPDSIRGLFTHELEMSAPDEGEREGILRNAVSDSGAPLSTDVDLSAVAVKTAALVAGDLVDVVERALIAKTDRLESLASQKAALAHEPITVRDIQLAGGAAATTVTPADFDAAVDLARKNFADSIGAPKIPNVQWSDVGGLSNVKDAVVETIQLPLSRPELFAKGLKKRSGILFYGPPGTGKTLLAKAIATSFSLNFFSVKGPELLNMYIGESEANVRRVFQRARDARPCVVFFDELDSVAPKRGNQGDSGGVMDRIVSQLLAELDGMSDGDDGGGGVFVIGATNRPDLLDQALLRPGRFDKMLYLGISDTHEKQATILQALTRKFTLDPSVSLPRVAETLPFTFTGADLYALCSDAMLKAVTRSARLVDHRVAFINSERANRGQNKISVAYYFDHYGTEADTDVMVTEEDFKQAKAELVPSVSLDELKHYERVRNTFEGTTKKEVTAAPTINNAAAAVEIDRPLTASSMSSSALASPTESSSNHTSISSNQHHSSAQGLRGLRMRISELHRRGTKIRNASSQSNGLDGHASQQRSQGQHQHQHQHSQHQHSPSQTPSTNGEADSGDDYVDRTDRMTLGDGVSDAAGKRSPAGKGKGKGKAREPGDGPGPSRKVADDEDLYD